MNGHRLACLSSGQDYSYSEVQLAALSHVGNETGLVSFSLN